MVGMTLGSAAPSEPCGMIGRPFISTRVLLEEDSPKLWMVGWLSLPKMPCDAAELTPKEEISGMEEYICSRVVAPVAAIWAESTAMMLEPTGAAPLMLVPVTTTVSRPV